ncbi:maleylpyruvate isomerase N-terminal domain-containing protein [Nocardia fusca]|uniref:maleylpyruvate isomerase N-terminal domain-containing protein n=1 Tax=Nocardia fusca TaxID=941183 RepID=UPI00378E5384
MAAAPTGPADRHAFDAARFTELVESAGPGDWSRPSPVAEWTALDIVAHLVEWSRGLRTLLHRTG